MKKFYYKREDTSVDKKPIILERRNTVSQDVKGEVENRLSTRTTSLGSVDQLKTASLIPRIQNREITKSLSEDVLNRCYMKNPGKVITERELAASKLYKTRKASLNSKDSPQKASKKAGSSTVNPKDPKFKAIHVPHKDCDQSDSLCLFPQPVAQKNDLSPVSLKDPKFKPVPVQPKYRKKESSCLCYCGIFAAISLCTIGILAGVTGLLYSEIFSDKNSTSHRLQESMIDLTNLIENSSIHEYSVLNNENSARKISFESVDNDSGDIRRSGSNLIESEDTDSAQFKQMDMTDLSRLIDNNQAEIKFQDRHTTIFEVNAGSSAEQKNSIDNQELIKEETNSAEIAIMSENGGSNNPNTEHVSDVLSHIKSKKYEENESHISDDTEKQENIGAITDVKQEISDPTTDSNQTHNLFINDHLQEIEVPGFDSEKEDINHFRTLNIIEQGTDSFNIMNKNLENYSNNNIAGEDFEVDKNAELEKKTYIEGLLNSELQSSKDSLDIDHDQDLNFSDKKSSDEPEDHSTTSVPSTKFENESFTFTENLDAVILSDKNTSKPGVKLNQINVEFQTVTVSLPKDKVVWKEGNAMKVSNVNNGSEQIGKEISNENLDANDNSKIEHHVEEILEVITEPGDDVHDPFDVNRNGDINIEPDTSNLWLKHNSDIFKVKEEEGDSLLFTESQKDQMPKETLRVKPSNMKVSLAEAMKHLQTLDINNKLLTSRMKSVKPKAQREKPSKLDVKQMKPLPTLDLDKKLLASRMKSFKPEAQKEKLSKLDKQMKPLQTFNVDNKHSTSRTKYIKPEAQSEKPIKLSDKHRKLLLSLDVSNKIITSRMKSVKPKDQREKPSKLNDKQIKESKSMDRMQLLHNLRLALQGNLMEL